MNVRPPAPVEQRAARPVDDGVATVARGESEYEPVVGRHERIAVDVTVELLMIGVLPALVLERHLPPFVTQIRVGDHAAPTVDDRKLYRRLGQVTVQEP